MKLMEMVGMLFLPSLFVAGMATGILCGVPGWMSEGGSFDRVARAACVSGGDGTWVAR